MTVFDDGLRTLVSDMFETMYDESGVGLAATQIDIHERVIVLDCGGEEPNPLALINPEIIHRDGTFYWAEGCLSIPGVRADVERSETITIRYHDGDGTSQLLDATGLLSVCIQHEIDHLDGLMYFDRMGPLESKSVLNAYQDYLETEPAREL